jgi:multidrug/hemolysin transport system permease protein
MSTLIKRNTLLFFRDRANIFFSMLSVIIIVALFALFLGAGDWGSVEIRDSWLMAGVLAVATLTTSLGAFTVMVEDTVSKISKGFYASPVKRSHITAAYIASPFIVGVLMATLTAIAFGAYILATGGELPRFLGVLQLMGLILLSSLNATAMVCFIVSFIKTNSVFGTVNAIIGTFSGFLMGIYMPIGNLPRAMQTAVAAFPPFHSAMLFRKILMARPLEIAFQGAAPEDLQAALEMLGVEHRFGDFLITPVISVAYLAVSVSVFFGLAAMNMRNTRR